MTVEVKQLATDAIATLAAAASMLSRSTPSARARDSAATRSALTAAVEAVKTEASKLGLFLTDDGRGPTAEEVFSLLEGLQQKMLQLYAVMHSMLTAAGVTLQAAVQAAASDITVTSTQLVESSCIHGVPGAQLTKLVGRVFNSCDTVAKTPVDNRTAVGRALSAVGVAVKDTLREVQELIQAPVAQQGFSEVDKDAEMRMHQLSIQQHERQTPDEQLKPAEAHGACGSEGEPSETEDLSDDLLDFKSDSLTPAEHARSKICHTLIDAALSCLRTVIQVLLSQADASLHEHDSLTGWEVVVLRARDLGTSVNDLGSGLFAPQDFEQLTSDSGRVLGSCKAMLAEVPEQGSTLHSGHIQQALRQVTEAYAACDAAWRTENV